MNLKFSKIISAILLGVIFVTAVEFAFFTWESQFPLFLSYQFFSLVFLNKFLFAIYLSLIAISGIYVIKKIQSLSVSGDLLFFLTLPIFLLVFFIQFGRLHFYSSMNSLWRLSGLLCVIVGLVIIFALLLFYVINKLNTNIIYVLVGIFFLVLICIPYFKIPRSKTAKNNSNIDKPNVIFLMIDTVHAGHLSTYGYERKTSPNLTKFSKKSLQFEKAIAPSSWTKPSVASIFTGIHSPKHNTITYKNVLSSSLTTLPEFFNEQGFRTAGFSSNPHISPYFGFNQGFQTFKLTNQSILSRYTDTFIAFLQNFGLKNILIMKGTTTHDRDAETINNLAKKWMANHESKNPFFLYLHYMDPHGPYAPPKNYLQNKLYRNFNYSTFKEKYLPPYVKRLSEIYPFEKHSKPPDQKLEKFKYKYDSEIRYWDYRFGKLMDWLKRKEFYKNSIILVVADHGEEFFQHYSYDHGHSLFQEILSVPLLIKFPSEPSETLKQKSNDYYSLVNIPRDLSQHIFPKDNDIFSETQNTNMSNSNEEIYSASIRDHQGITPSRIYSLINPPYKILEVNSRNEMEYLLYNLKKDPGERNSVKKKVPQVFKSLRRKLTTWKESTNSNTVRSKKKRLDKNIKNQLKNLGYFE